MNTTKIGILCVTSLLCASVSLLAQGTLTPPGPPGAIMKTLEQVEPRTPVSSLPFTISVPGSYYLTTNLNGAGGAGLTIDASQVTVDLMGFEIAEGSGDGIAVSGTRSNIWIRNGTVRGWNGWGVNAASAVSCIIENVSAAQNGSSPLAGGLHVGAAAVVKHCTGHENTGPGIQVSGNRGRIQANHLILNGRGVLASGSGNVIIHNSASGNYIDYDVAPGNDLGPIGSAATLGSPWGNIGVPLMSLTVTIAGSGSGSVTGSPSGINCGMDCTEDYPFGSMITLTATPAAGSTFVGWTGVPCMGTGPCTVTMDAAKTATATFALNTHTLTVAKTGSGTGTVTSSPAGVNCGGDCSEPFTEGTMVTLTASPGPNSTFTGWSGGCSGTGGCTVTMDAAKTVTATFALNNYTLTTTRAGAGNGVITSSPAGINCGVDCNQLYSAGTMVVLTATPAAGSTFAGWSGDGCSGTGSCTVTMDAAKSVTATFNLNSYTLTLAKAGPGSGTVTSSPFGINCGGDCTESFTSGTMVTLTAAPNVNSTFAGWTGGGCSGTGPCTVTITAATTVTAMFNFNSYTLNVVRAGTGTGTVTSSPAGINCGVDCNENYNAGTMVTLTATPAGGSTFMGWSGGGCSGTGTCTVSVNAAATVTATFDSP